MTRYQLTLEADNLKRVGRWRKGCPMAVVTITGGSREGEGLGKTESLDTLNPRWSTPIFVETDSSVYLPIVVEIYDYEEGRDKHKMVEANFEVTDVFQSQNHTQYEKVKGGTTIRASVIESIQGPLSGMMKLQFRLLDVKNVERGLLGLGRTDPFIELSKKNVDPTVGEAKWIVAYRSEHVVDNLNPVFKQVERSTEELCYCDPEWPLRITVYDWQKSGRHRILGVYDLNLAGLQESKSTTGNADRDRALEVVREGGTSTKALLIVLEADLC